MSGGLILDRYRILKRLAIGGMGEIFLGRQIGSAGFDRPVIIKRLLPDLAEDEAAVEQFMDEARIAATLNHPNIVAVYDVSEWKGSYFIAMEYIEGEPISAMLRALTAMKERMPYPIAARIIHDAALALDHAHNAKLADGTPLMLIHRDVSPQNIMVRRDGVTKVVDFGIAKVADRSGRTAAGVLKGKIRYMPPEQLRELPVDHRSDQFSLGVTLWEMCTGRRLFKKDLTLAARLKIERLPAPALVQPDIPEALDRIIQRTLQADRNQRFPSCRELARALDEYLAMPEGRIDLNEVAALVERTVGDRIAERAEILRVGEAADDELDVLDVPQTPAARVESLPDIGPPKRRTPWVALTVAVTGALALAAAVIFATMPRHPAAPPIVLVQKETPVAPPPETSPVSLDARLTRAFESKRSEVVGCIDRFGKSAPAEVSVRFEVDASGRVTAAEVLPAEVSKTELGRCLAELARTTKFPPQQRAVSFRIPLRIARPG